MRETHDPNTNIHHDSGKVVITDDDGGKITQTPQSVVLKNGKVGLRFGPVVTGHVAIGKDGCGY